MNEFTTKNGSQLKGKELFLTNCSILSVLSELAEISPDQVAISSLHPNGNSIERSVSRSELLSLASNVANTLLEENIQPNDPVLICCNRCPEQIAALIEFDI